EKNYDWPGFGPFEPVKSFSDSPIMAIGQCGHEKRGGGKSSTCPTQKHADVVSSPQTMTSYVRYSRVEKRGAEERRDMSWIVSEGIPRQSVPASTALAPLACGGLRMSLFVE